MRVPRPSASLLVSTAALMVALGGTSYAALKIDSSDIKDNSVKSSDIKDKTIKSRDIKKGGVKSSDVRDASLQAKDFKPGQIPTGPAGVGRWALINAAGQIEAQSGGFSVTAAYPVLAQHGRRARARQLPARQRQRLPQHRRAADQQRDRRNSGVAEHGQPGRRGDKGRYGRMHRTQTPSSPARSSSASAASGHSVRPSGHQQCQPPRGQPSAQRRPGHRPGRGLGPQEVLRHRDRRLDRPHQLSRAHVD